MRRVDRRIRLSKRPALPGLIAVQVALSGLLTAGCDSVSWDFEPWRWGGASGGSEATAGNAPPPPVDEGATEREPQATLAPGRHVSVLHITFDIVRVRATQGAFSASGRIWNHLDESTIPMSTASVLQRNGFRVARGRMDAWPPIAAILESEPKVESSRSGVTVANGLPLVLELDPRWRDQVLFLYRPDGTGAGFSYPSSNNLLRVDYQVPLSDRAAVVLHVMPEIRLPRREPSSELRLSGWRTEPAPQPVRLLHELAFDMQIGPDEFLVVGPSSAVGDARHLTGSLFLTEEVDGRPLESVYFITPTIGQTTTAEGRP